MSVLVDSDVLIWWLRGSPKAKAALDGVESLRLSAASHIEIMQGCRNKQELAFLQLSFHQRAAIVLPLSTDISYRAQQLIADFALSHGLQLADALIAATALVHDLTLLSANGRHFRAIPDLRLKLFRP